jgi:hypothetical protein
MLARNMKPQKDTKKTHTFDLDAHIQPVAGDQWSAAGDQRAGAE